MAVATKQRINSLISRQLSSTTQEGDWPTVLELCDIIRRGSGLDVLDSVKPSLKHGPPPMQLRALKLVDMCVRNSGPQFALLLSQEDWTERIFRIAKDSESDELKERIMVNVTQWGDLYSAVGFVRLIQRFSQSKTLGPKYAIISSAFETERAMQRRIQNTATQQQRAQQPTQQRVNGESGPSAPVAPAVSSPPPPAAQSAVSRTSTSEHRHMALGQLESFIVEAQSDLASLQYGLQRTEALDERMMTECLQHRITATNILEKHAQLPDDARQALIALIEELNDSLSIYEVICKTEATTTVPPPPPHDAEDGDEPTNDVSPLRSQPVSRAAETAQIQVEANTMKILDEERKEGAALRHELEELRNKHEQLKEKFRDAKEKNKKAVDLLDEEMKKNADLQQQLESKQAVPPPPPPQPVVKVVKPTVDRQLISRVRAAFLSLKRSARELRDSSRDIKKEADVFVAQLAPAVNHILKATEVDRASERKALQWAQELYKKEMKLRKQYYNTIQELKGNIRVYCRVRPMSETELSNGHENACSYPSEDEVRIIDDKGKSKIFEFDRVFPPESTQSKVFEDTAPLIDSVVDGYNVCIFAYGQTGSGKTFTMSGFEDKGINKRALERLFGIIEERAETERSTVHISVLEIYCEQIRDLLVSRAEAQRVSYEVHSGGPYGQYVSNLAEMQVRTTEEIESIMAKASANRSEGKTDMNLHSSRSHMLLYVLVRTTNNNTGVQSYGKLSLVDLAGSERLDKSGSEGQAAKEAAAINRSLSALGDVIAGLSSSAKHVPFRNSILTYLLQDSMCGQAKVLMFCCISPASYNVSESQSSLGFASRARGVSLGAAKKNVAVDSSPKDKK